MTFFRERPQKVSITQDIESSLEYPTLTLCSPVFFSKDRWEVKDHNSQENKLLNQFRLAAFGLDDENDDLANYLILSLQIDQITPQINVHFCIISALT